MKIRLFRIRVFFIWIAALISLVCLYSYYYYANSSLKSLIWRYNGVASESLFDDYPSNEINTQILKKTEKTNELEIKHNGVQKIKSLSKCHELDEATGTIDSLNEYQNFEFNASWIRKGSIWTEKYEKKYEKLFEDKNRPPLHVVVMPHSHNDPGWLKTFEEYFQSHTHHILDNVVKKLPTLQDMTFIWTEISFLELWWKGADENQRKTFKELVDNGRVEITTGGWVMTDEAAAHIYSMVDQLIEGHQWLKTHLNVTPKHSWSIDPFGHGSTMPYIYGTVDFEGSIIQRIHSNWKEWLASRQYGDFLWRPSWMTQEHENRAALTHNMPFDMYFVDSSCGPHIDLCKPYDFRWFGNIMEKDLQHKADQLIGEYSRSASLYPHNTFLAIVGGDFRYEVEYEFDSQYNYKKIIDYVNANPDRYNNTKMQFGTVKDYFKIINERTKEFPTFTGDFMPLGDISSNKQVAYWTGYYTTRPFLKLMCRDLEHNLRNAEILLTLGLNKNNHSENLVAVKELQKIYPKLVTARRNLALFQHHDAITGTSKARVMQNYLDRMFASLKDTIGIQELAIKSIVGDSTETQSYPTSTKLFGKSNEIPKDVKLKIDTEILLFNSLPHERIDLLTVHVSDPNNDVFDSNGVSIPCQVNSIFERKENSSDVVELDDEFEVLCVVKLPPLSLTTYRIKKSERNKMTKAKIFKAIFVPENIQIKNSKMLITFNKSTGFIQSMRHQHSHDENLMEISFGAYNSSKGKSGAYLFKPDESRPFIKDIFGRDKLSKIIVIEGPIASFVKVFYGKLLIHSIRLLQTYSHLDEGLYIENQINMSRNHSDFEIFMRIKSPIENKDEFFTDLNGFQWQRRRKVSRIGVEGNYYPITSGAFIQDNEKRLTLLTGHAQGATSPDEGIIEVMLDRRTPADDHRGVEEGVTDNIENIQNYWITMEFQDNMNANFRKYQTPTIHASSLSQTLKYPVNTFAFFNKTDLTGNVEFLTNPFPCDVDLFNMRTITSEEDESLPSNSALFILHRKVFDCKFSSSNEDFYERSCEESFGSLEIFKDIRTKYIEETSLTGLKNHGFTAAFSETFLDPMEIRAFKVKF